MIDLKKLLREVKEEQAIQRALRKRAPLPEHAMRVGSRTYEQKARRESKLERDLESKEIERTISRAQAQARYHQKNKKKLNYRRKLRARKPEATFKRARRRAELRGQEWKLTFEEWWKIWQEAPEMMHPTKKYLVPAWEMRGGNYKTDAQMVRLDTDLPWEISNVTIQTPQHGKKNG